MALLKHFLFNLRTGIFSIHSKRTVIPYSIQLQERWDNPVCFFTWRLMVSNSVGFIWVFLVFVAYPIPLTLRWTQGKPLPRDRLLVRSLGPLARLRDGRGRNAEYAYLLLYLQHAEEASSEGQVRVVRYPNHADRLALVDRSRALRSWLGSAWDRRRFSFSYLYESTQFDTRCIN